MRQGRVSRPQTEARTCKPSPIDERCVPLRELDVQEVEKQVQHDVSCGKTGYSQGVDECADGLHVVDAQVHEAAPSAQDCSHDFGAGMHSVKVRFALAVGICDAGQRNLQTSK